MSASTEEFHFSGPAEELDYTEPADFTFPGQPSGGEAASEHSGELAAAEPAEAEGLFGPEGIPSAESPPPEDAAVEPELAGEGIADLETAEEEKPKPKLELPAWVQTAQWVMVGLLAVGSLVAVICSIVWVPQNPKQVTLTLNICCPLMLALIPFALWRSSARWVTPATSARVYGHVGVERRGLDRGNVVSGTGAFALRLAVFQDPGKCRQATARDDPAPRNGRGAAAAASAGTAT